MPLQTPLKVNTIIEELTGWCHRERNHARTKRLTTGRSVLHIRVDKIVRHHGLLRHKKTAATSARVPVGVEAPRPSGASRRRLDGVPASGVDWPVERGPVTLTSDATLRRAPRP